MLDSLTLPPLPTLYGERVILRGPRDSDVDDRLRHPIDPEEEDGYPLCQAVVRHPPLSNH